MNNKIPILSLDEIGISNVSVKLIETKEEDGNIMDTELEIITKIVSKLNAKRIFEIGTFDGRTTINLAKNTPKDAEIFTLDLPPEQISFVKLNLYSKPEVNRDDKRYINKSEIGLRYKQHSEQSKIIQLLGDSATFNFSTYYHSMDFIFVDGSHSQDYVKSDTEIVLKLAHKNSIIMWHDYTNWEDVTNVMDNYFEKDSRFKDLRRIEGTTFLYLHIQ